MQAKNKEDQQKVDALMDEIRLLKKLIAEEQDDDVAEELKLERTRLIAQVNGIYGTDHIAPGSKISVINNDLNTD